MALRALFFLMLAAAVLASASFSPPAEKERYCDVGQLIVVVDGDPANWANWGFLWDAGERRNGRPWVALSGMLDPSSSRSQLEKSNTQIYYGITDRAWEPAIGPTEVEILSTIAGMGYKLVEREEGAFHAALPQDLVATRKSTYWFQR